ncbi:MAG: ABC transporter ATP-binding protein [Kofleriaceae bacterium]|nr:ABC transporter ATP-binding protein [Myxococcales bacterium]MCB9573306.1 ABC transporter ATP-binding protein [Kofleriaceae bacterium]
MLELRGLGKDYGARTAVGAVDLDVAEGEIFGLLGPNGAGKTTTISMIAGVVTPSRGAARIAGHDVLGDRRAARAALGLVPQDLALYEELTPRENLAFFGALYGLRGAVLRERTAWVLDVAGLAERADDPARTFSGGMKRRLNLAAGLLHRPRLVVLDEPTVGVDPQSRKHIFDTIRALRDDGMTVLYTSHYMEEVEALCDRVAIMDHGAVVAQGTLDELLAADRAVVLEIELDGDDFAIASAATLVTAFGDVERDGAVLRIQPDGPLAPVIAAIESAGLRIAALRSHRPDLEAVFLGLTGHTLRDD